MCCFKKRGVFIIELIGGGLSTRVMIRKGSLTLIKQSLKGIMKFYVVNEKKEICKENVSLLFDDQIYKADTTDGKILIPMGKSIEKSQQVIIIHNDFSSIAAISLPKESYTLKLDIIYNRERFLPGTLCEFVL